MAGVVRFAQKVAAKQDGEVTVTELAVKPDPIVVISQLPQEALQGWSSTALQEALQVVTLQTGPVTSAFQLPLWQVYVTDPL